MLTRTPILNRINIFSREKDGEKVIVSKRRDMSRFDKQPAGVKSFTKKANARSKAANRARNKTARASRKRNRA